MMRSVEPIDFEAIMASFRAATHEAIEAGFYDLAMSKLSVLKALNRDRYHSMQRRYQQETL